MAITFEEEKKPTNIIAILGAVLAVFIVFVGGYFLFFKKPDLIDVVVPASLAPLNELSQIQQFDPVAVLQSSGFKALHDYSSPLPTLVPGRADPFVPAGGPTFSGSGGAGVTP